MDCLWCPAGGNGHSPQNCTQVVKFKHRVCVGVYKAAAQNPVATGGHICVFCLKAGHSVRSCPNSPKKCGKISEEAEMKGKLCFRKHHRVFHELGDAYVPEFKYTENPGNFNTRFDKVKQRPFRVA